IAREVAEAYRQLHLFPTHPVAGVRFYSCAWARAYELDSQSAAESILAQAIAPVDFPVVINRAYEDGVRVFLEMGPGASCSRMIDAILGSRPHLARSACIAGQDTVGTVLRMLGSLIVERVPVDLDVLYGQPATGERRDGAQKNLGRSLVVRVGGEP